jgi:hypothetical protein
MFSVVGGSIPLTEAYFFYRDPAPLHRQALLIARQLAGPTWHPPAQLLPLLQPLPPLSLVQSVLEWLHSLRPPPRAAELASQKNIFPARLELRDHSDLLSPEEHAALATEPDEEPPEPPKKAKSKYC